MGLIVPREFETCTSLAHDLPRHDVGVVLHGRDHHLVAGGEAGAAIGVSHQVDRLRDAPHEYHLVRLCRIDEALQLHPGPFKRFGGLLAQLVHAAVNVGVVPLVVLLERIHHGAWLLRGRGVVEVRQRLPVPLLLQ
jgi:hypothetical protein